MVRKGYERVMCERWVGDWTKTATYWPTDLLAIAALLSHPAGLLNRGPRGPSSLLGLVLTASNCSNWLQTPNSKLTELPVAPGYIIVLRPPASCERHICTEFNPSTVKAIPWYLRPDAPVPWLTAGSICYRGRKEEFEKVYQRVSFAASPFLTDSYQRLTPTSLFRFQNSTL